MYSCKYDRIITEEFMKLCNSCCGTVAIGRGSGQNSGMVLYMLYM